MLYLSLPRIIMIIIIIYLSSSSSLSSSPFVIVLIIELFYCKKEQPLTTAYWRISCLLLLTDCTLDQVLALHLAGQLISLQLLCVSPVGLTPPHDESESISCFIGEIKRRQWIRRFCIPFPQLFEQALHSDLYHLKQTELSISSFFTWCIRNTEGNRNQQHRAQFNCKTVDRNAVWGP